MRFLILAVAILHALFMVFEILPPKNPKLLQILSNKLAKEERLSEAREILVTKIVQNAGTYNGIIAGGLAWSASTNDTSVAQVLLIGAGVAGVFGTLTLKSPLTAIQALAGIAGAVLVASRGMG